MLFKYCSQMLGYLKVDQRSEILIKYILAAWQAIVDVSVINAANQLRFEVGHSFFPTVHFSQVANKNW